MKFIGENYKTIQGIIGVILLINIMLLIPQYVNASYIEGGWVSKDRTKIIRVAEVDNRKEKRTLEIIDVDKDTGLITYLFTIEDKMKNKTHKFLIYYNDEISKKLIMVLHNNKIMPYYRF